MADEDIDGVPPGEGEKKVDDTTYKTIADAYYRTKLEAPKAARSNSQNAYTIAAAVAAAVVAAGAFANLSSQPAGVQAVGVAALAVWLVTAGIFMWAVAAPYQAMGQNSVSSEIDFVNEALRRAKSETESINARQRYARFSAVLASLLTVVALGLALFLPAPSTTKKVVVKLSSAEQQSLSELCEEPLPTVVPGTADTKTIGDGTIEFDPAEKACKTPGSTSLQEKETVFLLGP